MLERFIPIPKKNGDIVVVTKYLTKWAEAKAVKIDTVIHAATFMYENIISRSGCPKIFLW